MGSTTGEQEIRTFGEGFREKLRKFLQLFQADIRRNSDEDDAMALGSLVKIILKLMPYHGFRIVSPELHHPELLRAVFPKALNVKIVIRRRSFPKQNFHFIEDAPQGILVVHGNSELFGISLPSDEGTQGPLGKNSRIQKGFVSFMMADENISPEGFEHIIFCGTQVNGLCHLYSLL
jgi:hypothetical protein